MTSKEIEDDGKDTILELYLVYYGRAPDPAGLTFWVGYLAHYTLEETINRFGDSEEYTKNFGDLTHTELINNLYQQAFNRDAETDGLNHWLGELDSGAETLATIAYAIGSGAQNGDADILALKLAVAEVFTETLGKTVCDGTDYGLHSYASADHALVVRDFLLGVTDPSEIEAYIAAITDLAYTHFLVGVPRCDDNGQLIVVVDEDDDDPPVVVVVDEDDDPPVVVIDENPPVLVDEDFDPPVDPPVVVDVIAPVFNSGDTATIEENAPILTVVYDAQAVDNASGDDGLVDESISYSLSGEDAADFDINAENGEVTLKASADYETQSRYAIEVIATDPYSNVSVQTVTVSVTDLDEIAPLFYSGGSVKINENLPTSSPVYDTQAFDSGGEADVGITYRLRPGYDNSLFTITTEGVVYFRQSPDYENPQSRTGSNHYQLLIEASDESGNTNDKFVWVEILDVDEIAPVFFSGSYEAKNENLPRWNQVYDAQAVDSSGEIDVGITYALPALEEDNDLFTITSAGVVYFREIPDFENPLNKGKDNLYKLWIEASDEYGNTTEKLVTLKILDVDENPRSPPFTVNSRDAVAVAGNIGTVAEDGEITGKLVVTDPDSLPLTSIYSSKVLSSKKGSFTIDPDTGVWEYVPFSNFNGTDHAVVVVMDVLGNTSKVSIDFTVTSVVDLTADDDEFIVRAYSTSNVWEVWSNDDTTSGGPLSYDAVTAYNTGRGLFSIDNSGNIQYTPAKGFTGTDTVTYTVQDPTANEETTAKITFMVEPSISEISFTWNSHTSTFTAEASSSHTMATVTVEDENGYPVTIGTPQIELDGSNGLIIFDFSGNSFGVGGATANFDNWTFTFTDSNLRTAEATYDVIITSQKDIQGKQDAEIFLLRPWDVKDDLRNVLGSVTKYDYGTTHLGDQIFIALPDTAPNDQYITPTVGSHIEGTSGVFTTVLFDVHHSHIKLILAESGATSTAQIFTNPGNSVGPIAGVITMTYVDGIVGDYGDDELTGNSQDNFIYGEDGADILKGGGGNDFLSGGTGHDVLFGGPGNNTIDGGSGNDTASYAGFSVDLTIDWREDTKTVTNTDPAASEKVSDTLKDIEKIIGGSGDDTFLAGDSRFKWFDGGDGDDHFHGYDNVFFEGGNDADTFHIDFTPGNKVTITDYNQAEGDIIQSTTPISIVIKTVANVDAFVTINSGGVLDAGFTFLAEEDIGRNVTQKYALRQLLRDNDVTLSTPSQKSLLMVTDGTNSGIWYIEGNGDDFKINITEMTLVVFLVGVTSMDEVSFVDLF